MCISELGHLNLASQLFISPLNIKTYYVFKNLNSLQSHRSQQHQSILSFSENQTTCLWSECRCLEKNSASCPLKKKRFGNQTIAFGTAWKCENIFVVLPHRLMLFTSICDSQPLIKLHKKEHRRAFLCTFGERYLHRDFLQSFVKQTGERTHEEK